MEARMGLELLNRPNHRKKEGTYFIRALQQDPEPWREGHASTRALIHVEPCPDHVRIKRDENRVDKFDLQVKGHNLLGDSCRINPWGYRNAQRLD
ncbi:hypothetical protein ElyMa_002212200 [Elysia marginata]|uniref:Uncharacterized protein n=1 Tax=Elysia marginata TaxID=1093978 RepID=A0AAV4FUE9_9GAST|nr:hypothetical protein ElyMa_002212200 [Elysia marginata]